MSTGEPLGSLRARVRAFLRDRVCDGSFVPACDAWMGGFDRDFSRRLAAEGWVGMTVPPMYGGHGRTGVQRYVVMEELLAAGAPVAAHWIADRQVAPALVKHGTERQKRELLPGICHGELTFCLGLSEPDAGSDLTSLRTTARAVGDSYVINGTKVWSTGALHSQFMLALVRTSRDADRHAGLTQVLIDLSLPGVEVRPIRSMDGEAHFTEVAFRDVVIDIGDVLGSVGNGWQQILAELTDERSGPERFLSTMPLLRLAAQTVHADADSGAHCAIGSLAAAAWAIRSMSARVASLRDRGEDASTLAAMVKVLGARYERDVIDTVRLLADVAATGESALSAELDAMTRSALVRSPAFSLRGGTTEILRGLISRAVA